MPAKRTPKVMVLTSPCPFFSLTRRWQRENSINFKIRATSIRGQPPLLGWCTRSLLRSCSLLEGRNFRRQVRTHTSAWIQSKSQRQPPYSSSALSHTCTHTSHSTCQRREHFPQALPAQFTAVRASTIVKTWEEKLPCLDTMEENIKKKKAALAMARL